MTDVVVSALEQAAIPTAIAAIDAFDTAVTNLNLADPLALPERAPGTLVILLGQLELAEPGLLASEGGAVASLAHNVFAALRAKLVAAQSPAAAPAAPVVKTA